MAIDILTEQLISMAEASARLPGRPSLCTLWRWAVKGCRGRRLETVTIGGRRYCSVESLARFARHQGTIDAPSVRSPHQRDRAIARAERELRDAAGI